MALSMVMFVANSESAQESSNLNASVTVSAKCLLSSVVDVAFGADYDPTSATDNQSGVGSFNMRCTKNVSYDLYIAGTREMTDGTDTLAFQLYSDAFTTQWPSASGTPVVSGSNAIVGKTVNGEITAGLDVGAGSYDNTASPLVITIDY
jgi:spore coat protein U-like protein